MWWTSSKQTESEETGRKSDSVNKSRQPTRAKFCKRSSFRRFPLIITGEFTSAGSGPRLIPVVLPPGVAEHILCNSNLASLSANSLSQNSSPFSDLSLTIAIITGDYRLFIYPAKTTWVSLLGYNTAILYSSLFPLPLSGPSISNPPTSNSLTNHIITPLAVLPRRKDDKEYGQLIVSQYKSRSYYTKSMQPQSNGSWPRGTPFHNVLASPSALYSSLVSLSQYTERSHCIQSIQLYSSGSWPQGAPLQQGRG